MSEKRVVFAILYLLVSDWFSNDPGMKLSSLFDFISIKAEVQ